jgi:hypothetical protein
MTAAVSVALGLFFLAVAAGKLTGHPASLAVALQAANAS